MVRVSPLDLYLEAIISGEPSECQQQATCAGTHLGVKPSGETVLCSRFESQFLGTIHDQEIEELVASSFVKIFRDGPKFSQAAIRALTGPSAMAGVP